MRGMGGVYKRGPVWWSRYGHHGRKAREWCSDARDEVSRLARTRIAPRSYLVGLRGEEGVYLTLEIVQMIPGPGDLEADRREALVGGHRTAAHSAIFTAPLGVGATPKPLGATSALSPMNCALRAAAPGTPARCRRRRLPGARGDPGDGGRSRMSCSSYNRDAALGKRFSHGILGLCYVSADRIARKWTYVQ